MNNDSDYNDSTTGPHCNDKKQEQDQKGATYFQDALAGDDKK